LELFRAAQTVWSGLELLGVVWSSSKEFGAVRRVQSSIELFGVVWSSSKEFGVVRTIQSSIELFEAVWSCSELLWSNSEQLERFGGSMELFGGIPEEFRAISEQFEQFGACLSSSEQFRVSRRRVQSTMSSVRVRASTYGRLYVLAHPREIPAESWHHPGKNGAGAKSGSCCFTWESSGKFEYKKKKKTLGNRRFVGVGIRSESIRAFVF
jgi:hypothetical protein